MLKWIVTTSILAASPVVPLEADEPAPAAVPAQPPSEQMPAPVKTGKERLSSKASDEQRVDNCKVPVEARGAVVRPDSCEDKTQTIPTN
jgi:hypothetical protein